MHRYVTMGNRFNLLSIVNIISILQRYLVIFFVLFSVFIYSMPGYSCTIKERMLYSSCKGPLLDLIQSLGVTIAKKVSTINLSLINYKNCLLSFLTLCKCFSFDITCLSLRISLTRQFPCTYVHLISIISF